MDSILRERLGQVERRLRWQRCLSRAAMGLALGLALSLALNLASRFAPLLTPNQQIAVGTGLVVAAVLLLAASVYVRKHKTMEVAKIVDRRASLKERLSTAVELAERGDTSALAVAQREDAARAAACLDPKALAPLTIAPRRLLVAAGLLVALVAALLLPNSMDFILAERSATAQSIKEERAKIEQVSKELEEAAPAGSSETREETQRAIDRLAEDLARPGLTKEEALAKIAAAQDKLAKLDDRTLLAERLGLEQLAKGLQGLSRLDPSLQAGASAKPDRLGEDLSDLAEKLDGMSGEQQSKAADSLSATAGALSSANPRLATQLARVADALRAGDSQTARDALNRAATELAETDRRMADQLAAERALSQLRNSQATIARAGSTTAGSFVRSTTGSGSSQTNAGASGQDAGANPGSGNSGTQGTGSGGPQGPGNVAGTTAPTSPGAVSSSAGQPVTDRPGTTGTGSYEPVFTPGGIDSEGKPMFLPGANDAGENESQWVATQPGSGSSVVPYSQVFDTYSAAAARSLDASDVPANLKEYVRGYFTSLEPATAPRD
ncbi:MAG: hypothetical protein HYX94_07855 [Chloroflexi bacterium]|nr:hypothetical protein [Chloroflexota bacterium]